MLSVDRVRTASVSITALDEGMKIAYDVVQQALHSTKRLLG